MKNEILLYGQSVTKETMTEFKKRYAEAVQRGETGFKFDEQLVLTAYAKYVIEYAESQMGLLE